MKKGIICVLLLALLLSLCACSSDSSRETLPSSASLEDLSEWFEEIESEPTTEPTTEAPTEPSTRVEDSYPDQLAVILANRALWLNNDEIYSPMMNYTVADFDQNGRLEIWFGDCSGTGFFTYMNIWELSEDLQELVPVVRTAAEYESQADVICSEADVYYDETCGHYYYIFHDDNRNGWAWNGTDVRAVLLWDGILAEQTLASRSCETDDNYVSTTTYYDASGNEISESEYEKAAANYFAGLTPMHAHIEWQSISDETIHEIDDATLMEALQASLDGFRVS